MEKVKFVTDEEPVQTAKFAVRIDEEGDAVLSVNDTSLAYVSAEDGKLYLTYIGQTNQKAFPFLSFDGGQIQVEV